MEIRQLPIQLPLKVCIIGFHCHPKSWTLHLQFDFNFVTSPSNACQESGGCKRWCSNSLYRYHESWYMHTSLCKLEVLDCLTHAFTSLGSSCACTRFQDGARFRTGYDLQNHGITVTAWQKGLQWGSEPCLIDHWVCTSRWNHKVVGNQQMWGWSYSACTTDGIQTSPWPVQLSLKLQEE